MPQVACKYRLYTPYTCAISCLSFVVSRVQLSFHTIQLLYCITARCAHHDGEAHQDSEYDS